MLTAQMLYYDLPSSLTAHCAEPTASGGLFLPWDKAVQGRRSRQEKSGQTVCILVLDRKQNHPANGDLDIPVFTVTREWPFWWLSTKPHSGCHLPSRPDSACPHVPPDVPAAAHRPPEHRGHQVPEGTPNGTRTIFSTGTETELAHTSVLTTSITHDRKRPKGSEIAKRAAAAPHKPPLP